jgi:hypothetical protein
MSSCVCVCILLSYWHLYSCVHKYYVLGQRRERPHFFGFANRARHGGTSFRVLADFLHLQSERIQPQLWQPHQVSASKSHLYLLSIFFFRIFFRFLFISSFVNYFFGDVALTLMIHVFPFIHSTRPPHSPPNFPISSLPLLPSCAQVGLEQYREGFPNDLPALLTCWVPADLVCFSIALHLRLPIRHIWSFFWTVYLSYFRGARK